MDRRLPPGATINPETGQPNAPKQVGMRGAKTREPQKRPKRHFFSEKTPETLAAQKLGGVNGGYQASRNGVPRGWTRELLIPVRMEAAVFARKAVRLMEEKGILDFSDVATPNDEAKAKVALEYAVGVCKAAVDGTRERLAAARLVLDFTKQKPASKVDATVRAEDFLEQLSKEF